MVLVGSPSFSVTFPCIMSLMERVGRSEDFTRVAIARVGCSILRTEGLDRVLVVVGSWWAVGLRGLMLLRRKPENWDVVLNFLCLPKSTISAFGDVLEKEILHKLFGREILPRDRTKLDKILHICQFRQRPCFVSRLIFFLWVKMVDLVWFGSVCGYFITGSAGGIWEI